jgi:arylsulfatase A-like enzyme
LNKKAALVLAVAFFVLLAAQCAREKPAPNVIVVLIDTLRWDALGCNGNPNRTSPNIDAVASEGIRFDQAVSTSGWTLPATASLLTGTWPLIHGGLGKGTALTTVRDELPTTAERFKEAGFNTVAYANSAFLSPAVGIDRGFDIYDHRNAYNRDIRRADETVSLAIERIRSLLGESSFILIHLYDPHLDYDPPAGYAARLTQGLRGPSPPVIGKICRELAAASGGRPPDEAIEYIKRIYLGEVAFVDAQIGRLIDELKKLELYDHTTLVITSDHGEEFWEHGGFEHGHTLYDELIRIPLIIKPPSNIRAAVKSIDAQVRIIDIMPTLFDLHGIEQPDTFLGSSLLPMIRGAKEDDRPAFSESTLYGGDRIALRDARYKYLYNLNAEEEPPAELYDRVNDPGETDNLVETEPEVARRLEGMLMLFGKELNERALGMSDLQPAALDTGELEALRSLGYIN